MSDKQKGFCLGTGLATAILAVLILAKALGTL